MNEIIDQLGDIEVTRLGACEKVIERGLASFVEVGEALLTIRDNRLYRSSFSTFEDYCKPSVEAWDSGSVATMVDNAPILRSPRSERQARELAPLRDNPEVMREVWQQTVEETDGKPTAIAIRERVEARRADAPGDKIAAEISAAIRNLRIAHEHAERALGLADQVQPTNAGLAGPAVLRAVVEDHPEWGKIYDQFYELESISHFLAKRQNRRCYCHDNRTRGVRVIRTVENGVAYDWPCCPECAALKEGQINEQ